MVIFAKTSKIRAFCVLVALAGLLVSASPAFAAPSTIGVTGAISTTTGAPAPDGDYQLTFSLWDKAAGGANLWQEGPVTLKVAGGRFHYALGATKAVSAAALAGTSPFLEVKVGTDAPLARVPLQSVAYSLRASVADGLECSGCVNSKHIANGSVSAQAVGFAYAAAADGIKGGAAATAKALDCTGCVTTKHMKFDGDVDLAGFGLKAGKIESAGSIAAKGDGSFGGSLAVTGAATVAKLTAAGDGVFKGTVAAKEFVGDGSKLTGIKTPSGECKVAGEVVGGINADGSLKCVKALDPSALPADGLNEISNDLLSNQFVDSVESAKTVPIPDNSPNGALSIIDFPDIGIAQEFEIRVQIANSNVPSLAVFLLPPNAPTLPADRAALVTGYPNNMKLDSKYKHYVLANKSGTKGKALDATYPTKVKPVAGDLTEWIGKNPKGKWRLFVVDGQFKNNQIDGEIVKWTINIQTLSNKKVHVKGNLVLDGDIIGKGGANVPLKEAKTQDKLWAELAGNNWKQCTWVNINSGTDVGKVVECTFNKKYDETWLRVAWNGTLRAGHNCNACCKRWYFAIDGSECKTPGRIEGNRYTWLQDGSRTDLHHIGHIEGYCKDTLATPIKKGARKIQFYIANCYNYGNNDGYTGWNATSRIMIQEVPPGQ